MKKHFSAGFEAAGLAFAVLLFSGILQATPITNVTDGQAPGSSRLVTAASLSKTVKAPVVASVNTTRQNADMARASLANCTVGSDCYKKVQVPEPQSLVMVGTGLLSMAGLIRRRLLR